MRPDLIGTLHTGDHFAGTVAQGDVSFGIDLVPPSEVNDVVRMATGGECDHRPRAVAGIGLPVVPEGNFVDALELRRDITRLREAFAARRLPFPACPGPAPP